MGKSRILLGLVIPLAIANSFGCAAGQPVRAVCDSEPHKLLPFKHVLERLATEDLLAMRVTQESLKGLQIFWDNLAAVELDPASLEIDSAGALMEAAFLGDRLQDDDLRATWQCRDAEILQRVKEHLLRDSVYLPWWEKKDGKIIRTNAPECECPEFYATVELRFSGETVSLWIGPEYFALDARGLAFAQGFFRNPYLALTLLEAYAEPRFLKTEPEFFSPYVFAAFRLTICKALFGHLVGYLAEALTESPPRFLRLLKTLDPQLGACVEKIMSRGTGKSGGQVKVLFNSFGVQSGLFCRCFAQIHAAGEKKRKICFKCAFAASKVAFLLEQLLKNIPPACLRRESVSEAVLDDSWSAEGALVNPKTGEKTRFWLSPTGILCFASRDSGCPQIVDSPVPVLLLLTALKESTTASDTPWYVTQAVRNTINFLAQKALINLLLMPYRGKT